ncbi:MAG: hypothetical protein WDM88_11210 [Galbitalea sp.]
MSGVNTAVTIPGGSTRTVSDGSVATFDDLPSGASCALTETNAGGATSTAILNSGGTVVSGDATTAYTLPDLVTVDTASHTDNQAQPAYTVRNEFDLAPLSITKLVDSSAVDQDGNPRRLRPVPGLGRLHVPRRPRLRDRLLRRHAHAEEPRQGPKLDPERVGDRHHLRRDGNRHEVGGEHEHRRDDRVAHSRHDIGGERHRYRARRANGSGDRGHRDHYQQLSERHHPALEGRDGRRGPSTGATGRSTSTSPAC